MLAEVYANIPESSKTSVLRRRSARISCQARLTAGMLEKLTAASSQCQDIGITSISPLYARLYTRGVVLTPGTELRAVEGSTVVVANVYSGAERRIEAVDTVVMAAGSRSTDGLYRALKGQVSELYAVGDCVAPRGVHQAILDATRVARAI